MDERRLAFIWPIPSDISDIEQQEGLLQLQQEQVIIPSPQSTSEKRER